MSKCLGSCHCGAVKFELSTSESLGPYFRCNCSLCSRKGAVMGEAPKSALRVTEGQEFLSLYQWNTRDAEHYFCQRCGIYTHHVMRGATEFVGINMGCIEGINVFALEPVSVGGGSKLSLVTSARDAT